MQLTTMTEASQILAYTGRLLGSGQAVAAERLVPDAVLDAIWPNMTEPLVRGGARMGIALTMIAHKDPATLSILADVEREWSATHAGGPVQGDD